MVIKVENTYYSNEDRGNGYWVPVSESAISYGIYSPEPTEPELSAMRHALENAQALDAALPQAETNDIFSDFLNRATPHADVVMAGPVYQAMRAYQGFRLARRESREFATN